MGLLVGTGELSRAPEAGSPVGRLAGEGESSREPEVGAVVDTVGDVVKLPLGSEPHAATTRTQAAARIVFEILIAEDLTVQPGAVIRPAARR